MLPSNKPAWHRVLEYLLSPAVMGAAGHEGGMTRKTPMISAAGRLSSVALVSGPASTALLLWGSPEGQPGS